jgi:hypothetical protein
MRKISNDESQNNIYKGNLNYLDNSLYINHSSKNKKHFHHSNFSLKSNNSESRLNDNPEKKNTIDIYKNEGNSNEQNNLIGTKNKGKKPIGNIINSEQKNILNLYSNPLFFGIKVLINSSIQKNQDEEKTNNKDKVIINNIIEEQNEDKKDDIKIEIYENRDEKKENNNEVNELNKNDEKNKNDKNEEKEEEKEKEEDKKSTKNIENDKKENEEKKEKDENKNEEDNQKKKKKKRKKKKN